MIRRQLGVLRTYAAQGSEQAREAMQRVFGLENSLKANLGEYKGLLDKGLMAKKQKEESDFRARVMANPDLAKKYGTAWNEIETALNKQLTRYKELRYRSLRGSRISSQALTIVQYVAEVKKPNGDRLDDFHESQLDSLKFRLFSPAPVYPQMEIALLTGSLQESLDVLGPDDPFIKTVLNGRTPAEAARQVVAGTKLGEPAFRKALMEGGQTAVDSSSDPAIVLARKIDPIVREVKKWMDDNIESVMTQAGTKIGLARFAVYGKTVYPDATFTLRLSYGSVKGYPMNGTEAPPKTTFYGLFDRSYGFDQKKPFHLPARYANLRDRINLSVPLNFVNTCDTVGGNSGSPVVDRNGEIVGIIFDGNIESLVGTYEYNEADNRSIAVHTAAMTEALRNIYDAAALADELEGK
jgi:hypothetical protein